MVDDNDAMEGCERASPHLPLAGATTPSTDLTPYQRRLFVLLGVASFFDGYDLIALSQVLPALRQAMGFGKGAAGLLFSVVNVGTVLAFFLVRRADEWGRKRLLTLTIAGYTGFTLLSGFAPELWSFSILQLCARIFLIAELATSMVIVAEEFPARRRGMVIGVVSAFSAVGAVCGLGRWHVGAALTAIILVILIAIGALEHRIDALQRGVHGDDEGGRE